MISVIVPCYNSNQVLEELVTETMIVLENEGYREYEFVLVNDCSPNSETLSLLVRLAEKYPFVKVIDLAKNTGQANAQITALRYAKGEIILNMDDDMQTHPKNIPVLLAKLNEGYDLVLGRYQEKKHSPFRRLLTRMNDKFSQVVLNKPADIYFTSFWVTRNYIRDVLIQYDHTYSIMEGLFLRTTSKIANVEVEHFERREGASGYNLWKLIKLWSNFTNFTVLPLRIAGVLGMLSAVIGFVAACVLAVRKIMDPAIVAGYTSVVCLILILFGLVLFFLGVLGEYVGRIFMCINAAPQQVIRRTWNIDKMSEKEGQESCSID